jgi:hypothetical protein
MANAFISFNTQTIHIKSFYTQQHCYVSLKTLFPGGIRTRVFSFLRQIRCPLRHAARAPIEILGTLPDPPRKKNWTSFEPSFGEMKLSIMTKTQFQTFFYISDSFVRSFVGEIQLVAAALECASIGNKSSFSQNWNFRIENKSNQHNEQWLDSSVRKSDPEVNLSAITTEAAVHPEAGPSLAWTSWSPCRETTGWPSTGRSWETQWPT